MHDDPIKALEMAGWKPGRIVKVNQNASAHVRSSNTISSPGREVLAEIGLMKKDILVYCGATNDMAIDTQKFHRKYRHGFAMIFLPVGLRAQALSLFCGADADKRLYYVPGVKVTTATKILANPGHYGHGDIPPVRLLGDLAYANYYYFGNISGHGCPKPSVAASTVLNSYFVRQKLPCVFRDISDRMHPKTEEI